MSYLVHLRLFRILIQYLLLGVACNHPREERSAMEDFRLEYNHQSVLPPRRSWRGVPE